MLCSFFVCLRLEYFLFCYFADVYIGQPHFIFLLSDRIFFVLSIISFVLFVRLCREKLRVQPRNQRTIEILKW